MPAKFASLILGIFVILAVGAYGIATSLSNHLSPAPCGADTMQCPDGSSVSRTVPNCSFAACPVASTTDATSTAATSTDTSSNPVVGEGQHCGGFIRFAPTCAAGLHCQLTPSRPDTGGVCVKDSTTSGSGSIAPYNSGISGTITTGPTCPVEHNPPQAECADKPYQTVVAIFRASDPVHAFVITASDANGQFKAPLPPGEYVVGAGDSNVPRCPHTSVTVGPSGFQNIAVVCDTGIR